MYRQYFFLFLLLAFSFTLPFTLSFILFFHFPCSPFIRFKRCYSFVILDTHFQIAKIDRIFRFQDENPAATKQNEKYAFIHCDFYVFLCYYLE